MNPYNEKPRSLTPDELAEAKQRYRSVKQIAVVLVEAKLDKDGAELEPAVTTPYVICEPTRQVIERGNDLNTADANRLYINHCVLAGDMELLAKDDSVYFPVLGQIKFLGEVKKVLS